MLVKGWMASEVVVIDENTSMMKATQMMKEQNIRRLPVLRKGKLVGIITDRDLKDAAPSKATSLDVHELYYLLSEIKVKDIMAKGLITINGDDTVEKAAVIMLENRISGLPVVNNKGDLIGVITLTDVLKVLVSITGIYQGGIQFAFSIEDRAGSIKEVSDTIRAHGGRMVSILTSWDSCEKECRHVFIRIMDMEKEKLAALTKEMEKRFIVLYTTRDDLSNIPHRQVVKTK
ncbi:MAG: CBS and ACT domain-containing protein [Deltaproteobacteria bacterium]|nr:CBS and ACT domain-containing protein [Deltaproteobacteria bacterium]